MGQHCGCPSGLAPYDLRDSGGELIVFDCVPTDQPSYGCGTPPFTQCATPNAVAACAGGACAIGQCQTGFGDCNHNPADGCEINLRQSDANCGTCGNTCPAGTTCMDGSCLASCGPPLSSCNGTCANLLTSVTNCGGCGVACTPSAGQIATCVNGGCVYTAACPAGLTTCGSLCVDTSADPRNCGGCGKGCAQLIDGARLCVNGQCACPAGLSLLSSQVECVDVTVSTDACGSITSPACATGQTCTNGVCQAPATIVTGVAVSDMAVDGTSVYFVDSAGGTVNAVPAGGGAPVVLASGQAKPVHLALDAQYVYFSANLGGSVMRVPKAGGTATVVAATTEPTALVVDDQNVYWLNGLNGKVQAAPTSGGTATVLADGQVVGTFLQQDAQSIYYVGANATILSIAKVGPSTPQTLASCGGNGLLWFAVDITGTYAYYACMGIMPLFAKALSGSGSAIEVWPSFPGVSHPLVADDSSIYSFGASLGGSLAQKGVVKLAYCRNTVEPFLLGLSGIHVTLLALDQSHLYWSDGAQIGRVAK